MSGAGKPGLRKPKTRRAKTWHVYMVECAGNRIYTGIALDVAARFEKHRSGRGAAFTRINRPVRVMAAMSCGNQGRATRKEGALKKMRRADKLAWAQEWKWIAS